MTEERDQSKAALVCAARTAEGGLELSVVLNHAVPEFQGSGDEYWLGRLADCLGSCAHSRVLDHYTFLLSRAPNPLSNSGFNTQVPSFLLALFGGCLLPEELVPTSRFMIFFFFSFLFALFLKTA